MEPAAPDQQHLFDVMSNIALFFGIAGVAVPLLQRLRLSPVLAYLLCGIIVGPHGLSSISSAPLWLQPFAVSDASTVQLLGEFGIIALMFMIGLEMSFNRLRELKRYVLGLGSVQILLTALVIFMVARAFDNSVEASMLIGASFALSSTAIVMQLLEERRLANRPVGTLCFSVLLMQDLAVVPILVMVGSFAGTHSGHAVQTMLSSLAIGTVTVAGIFLAGKRLIQPLLRWVSVSRNAEWLIAFSIFIAIACAVTTQLVGLSPALGAFLAGLLIAETEFKHEVEIAINPLKSMLLGVFFLSVGMMIDLAEVVRHSFYLLASVLGLFLLKASVLFPICRAFNIPAYRAAKASIFLAQPGEFAFLILSVALSLHLIPAADAQFFLQLTAIFMMLTPLLFKLAPIASEFANYLYSEQIIEDDTLEAESGFVVIAGFGRVGRLLGSILEEQRIPYVAVDNNPSRVQALKEQGFNVRYGDARRIALWHRLYESQIIAVAITIDDHKSSYRILKSLRSEWPMLPIIVRAKDASDVSRMYSLGAKHVIPETLESSLRMARLLMEEAGIEKQEAEKAIEKRWEQNALLDQSQA